MSTDEHGGVPNQREAQQRWVVLLDAPWSGEADGPVPTEAMIGGWPIRDDGTALPFEPNPDYRPRHPDAPTDPVDAATRMVVAGHASGETVLWALRDSVLWLAVDETGAPEVDVAPDGVRCVLVATSGQHRDRIDGPRWRQVSGAQLAVALPEHTDVLVNLGGPATMRLIGDVVRAAMTDPVES
ncbi:type VII secretion system-associated protein [Micromonospora sp. NPDC003197]